MMARGYHSGVLLYLTTLMELVSVASGNTLPSPTRTPGHKPPLALQEAEWGVGDVVKEEKICRGACVVHSPFAIASCVRDSRQG